MFITIAVNNQISTKLCAANVLGHQIRGISITASSPFPINNSKTYYVKYRLAEGRAAGLIRDSVYIRNWEDSSVGFRLRTMLDFGCGRCFEVQHRRSKGPVCNWFSASSLLLCWATCPFCACTCHFKTRTPAEGTATEMADKREKRLFQLRWKILARPSLSTPFLP